MYGRWGKERKDDFWTALAKGEVDTAELRAMELLESVCDSYRFHLYCMTGEMPAVGNVTGTTFMLAKSGGVVELDDGRVVKHWCISIGPHIQVPGTDNVVILKGMIEGEELEFRRIGNDNAFSGHGRHRPIGVADPYEASWMPDSTAQVVEAMKLPGDFSDLFSVPHLMHAEAKDLRRPEIQAEDLAKKRLEEAYEEADAWVHRERRPKQSGPIFTTGSNNAFTANVQWQGQQAYRRDPEPFDDNLQDLIAEEVRREVAGRMYQEDNGAVRLADGERIYWDYDQGRHAEERLGVNIREQVILMNGEGRSRDQIKWFMKEFFGVEGRDMDRPSIQLGHGPQWPAYHQAG